MKDSPDSPEGLMTPPASADRGGVGCMGPRRPLARREGEEASPRQDGMRGEASVECCSTAAERERV